MALILLSIAWIAGIYIGSKLVLPLYVISICFLPLLLIPFLSKYKKRLVLTGLCLLATTGGILQFQSNEAKLYQQSLHYFNDKGISEIEGLVITNPEFKGRTQVIQVSVDRIRVDNEFRQISGEAIIRVPRYPEYRYGDLLSIKGILETPQQTNDFNYKEYLARKGNPLSTTPISK